jgi:hypothetical protein
VTTLEIIDTIVKIGLGAFIGGLSTFFLESYRRKQDKQREDEIRYRENIEKPIICFVNDMLAFMSRAYWDRLDGKDRSMSGALEEIRDREAAVEARVSAMRDEALSKSFHDLDAAFIRFRQALGEGPLAAARPAMHEVHAYAGEFFRRMYPRPQERARV